MAAGLWCSGWDLLGMLHSVDQQYAAAQSAAALQWLLHRYCNSCVVDLVDIDLHVQLTDNAGYDAVRSNAFILSATFHHLLWNRTCANSGIIGFSEPTYTFCHQTQPQKITYPFFHPLEVSANYVDL